MIFSEKLVIELSKSIDRFAFVKVVHIELSEKGSNIRVPKIFREKLFCKAFLLEYLK